MPLDLNNTCIFGEHLGVQYWTMEEFRHHSFGWAHSSWVTFSEPVGDIFRKTTLDYILNRIEEYRETQFKEMLCV